jgi:hypothetical protein
MKSARFVRSNLVWLGVVLTLTVCGCGSKEIGKTDKSTTETKTATYDGTWSGAADSSLHVQQIVISSNDFPCKGSVSLQYGSGQTFNFNVNWEQKDGQLQGMYGLLGGKSIATAKLDGETLSGEVTVPIPIPNAPTGLTFSQFKKTAPAK